MASKGLTVAVIVFLLLSTVVFGYFAGSASRTTSSTSSSSSSSATTTTQTTLTTIESSATTLPTQATIQSQAVAPAISYLVANYNHTIGLIHESPDSGSLSGIYWLYSDNYLAQQALQSVSANNVSIAAMVSSINQMMLRYLHGQPNPCNQYMILTTGLFPFDSAKDYTFGRVDGAVIKSTVNNQTGTLSPLSYADVAFLQAIAYYRNGESQNALTVYRYGLTKWDGLGFKDSAYSGTYATYKLALYILASKTLGQAVNNSMITELFNLQLHTGIDKGGFATSYTGNGKPVSGTNTETTSLAILAFEANRYIPVGAFLYEWYGYDLTSGLWTGGLGTSHWNTTIGGVLQPLTIVKDEPDVGFYASDNNDTLAWQLSNMHKAGISVIIVSWWGVGNDSGGGSNAKLDAAINNATLNLFRYVESTKNLWNFQIAIMVEPFKGSISLTNSDYTNLYNYIENTFYKPFDDITFYWQGKPLLLSFNPPNHLPATPALSQFTYRSEGGVPNPVDWLFWEGANYNDSSGGTAQIKNYEYAPGISSDGEVGVVWRYDDSYLFAAGGRGGFMRFDHTGTLGMYSYEWNYVIQNRSSVNLVLLYGWNEYHERSALEPHNDSTVGQFNGVGITSYCVQALENPTTTVTFTTTTSTTTSVTTLTTTTTTEPTLLNLPPLVYVIMVGFLIVGLAVGYIIRRSSVSRARAASP